MRTLLILELKQLFHGRAVPVGLALLLAAGAAGIHHGRTVIQRQLDAIERGPALQREHHETVLASQPSGAEAGDQLYYLFFHTAHEPSAWAPFSIGQRDLQAFNLKIRLLALQGQLHDSDLANPLLAALGNFDAAFVLVVLVPLLVIVVAHNVRSAEEELGTWSLIRSQPRSAIEVLALKLAIRSAVVLAPALALIGLGVWWLGLPLDRRLADVALLTTAYVALWIGVVVVVIALGRSSDFNLVTLLGVWVTWAVLGPSLLTVVAAARFPVPEALELTVRQRQGYHASWDRPLRETMARFYERYPEWADLPVPERTYSNAWYYAMQQRGDDEAAPAVAGYLETLKRRQAWLGRAAALLPPAAFQLALNGVARTDLESHLGYLASVSAFHEELKRRFFPVIFHRLTIGEVDWANVPRHRFRDERPESSVSRHAFALTIEASVLLVAGLALLRRRVGRPTSRP